MKKHVLVLIFVFCLALIGSPSSSISTSSSSPTSTVDQVTTPTGGLGQDVVTNSISSAPPSATIPTPGTTGSSNNTTNNNLANTNTATPTPGMTVSSNNATNNNNSTNTNTTAPTTTSTITTSTTTTTTTSTTTTSTTTTTSSPKFPYCSSVDSYCLNQTYSNPTLNLTDINAGNVLSICGKDMYLKYCIQTADYRCGNYKRNSTLTWLKELCKRRAEFLRTSQCQENPEVLRECLVALTGSDYNNKLKYKQLALNSNTCLYEQLRVKCEAIARVNGGQNCRGFLEIYQYLVYVKYFQYLELIDCPKYVDVPCQYGIGFQHDIC